MAIAEFIYQGAKTIIQCSYEEKMEDILQRLCTKLELDKNNTYFIYGGSKVNPSLTFNEQATKQDKERNKISILVYSQDKNPENAANEDKNIKKAENVICPFCHEDIRISFKDYKINLFGCKNDHKINNILLPDFETKQKIDDSQIKCGKCNDYNKSNTYNKLFFRCLSCNSNLCPLCKSVHDKSHNIIYYDQMNFVCNLHNELYNAYCKNCKRDICLICEKEHTKHKKIFMVQSSLIKKI